MFTSKLSSCLTSRRAALVGAAAAAVAVPVLFATPASATPLGQVFFIAMENHNWTQPNPTSSPQQIFQNVAAPYINSLVDPNSPNSTQVSYSNRYFSAAIGSHPSEPNYVWHEAGTSFGVHTDADPGATNTFNAPHLTSLMNAKGVSWNNYQEDFERGAGPTHSASGNSGAVNPYYNTSQYNYAVKHNPMAFFTDTQLQNVKSFDQLRSDIAANNFAQYNWITPNQFNDQHSALSGGFTYNGTHYTGDQAAVAQGDNFLSIIVPQLMATPAYQNNGAIVIWYDETEGGDDLNHTIPEIVISPLAKGHAYASTVELNHSSDLRTLQEIYQLGPSFLDNPIPASETNVSGVGYNRVSTVNDLSDLFVDGTIPNSVPEPASMSVLAMVCGVAMSRRRRV